MAIHINRAQIAAALQGVKEVYDELEARPIERSCQRLGQCCYFKKTGETPYLTKGEALYIVQALREGKRMKLPKKYDGSCPLLSENNHCMVYENRPFGCRTHFCEAAGGMYKRREVIDLIRKLEDIDLALAGRGAIKLPAAIQEAITSPHGPRPLDGV